MMPLSGGDERSGSGLSSGRFKKEPTYSVHATGGGSEEFIVGKDGTSGIEYEREFTVEESYIGSSKVLPLVAVGFPEKGPR